MPRARKRTAVKTRKVKDPVCGMTVERKTAPYKEVFGGIEYCFCSRECWDAFQNEPARYSAQK